MGILTLGARSNLSERIGGEMEGENGKPITGSVVDQTCSPIAKYYAGIVTVRLCRMLIDQSSS